MTATERFQLRITSDERAQLRALAEEEDRSQSRLIRDLVREAVAAKRAMQGERWGPRLFGTEAASPDEAA